MINYLKALWRHWEDKLNQKPIFYRILILLGAIIIIFLLWYFLFYSPVDAYYVSFDQKNEVTKKTLTQLDKKIQSIREQGRASVQQGSDKAKLLADIKALNAKITAYQKRFVSPDQLVPLVKRLVGEYRGNLQLVHLKVLPPSVLNGQSKKAGNESKKKEETKKTKKTKTIGPVIYRYQVVVTLEGDYFSVLNYLKQLQALSKKILWGSLNYEVIKYPMAKVNLTLMTLASKGTAQASEKKEVKHE